MITLLWFPWLDYECVMTHWCMYMCVIYRSRYLHILQNKAPIFFAKYRSLLSSRCQPTEFCSTCYGVATIRRLLENICLFCKKYRYLFVGLYCNRNTKFEGAYWSLLPSRILRRERHTQIFMIGCHNYVIYLINVYVFASSSLGGGSGGHYASFISIVWHARYATKSRLNIYVYTIWLTYV